MTRVVRIHEQGGPEVLKIEDIQVPPPAKDEVRISVKAIGLNRAESMFRAGYYDEQPVFPARIGYEASGLIEAVGENVRGLSVGDAVSVIPPNSISRWGTYGELANVPADFVVKHHPSLDWNEAASLWMAAAVVYGALVDVAKLQKGDHVLVTAASSSIGLLAIQVANLLGAVPIATTRGAGKRAALLRAGAKHVIVTNDEDMVVRANEITQGKGVRVVFDAVAGPDVTKFTELMAPHGIAVIYGLLSPEPTVVPPMNLLVKRLTIRGFVYRDFVIDPAWRQKLTRFVNDAVASGVLRPAIAKVFALDEIIEATRYLESNAQIGKVVVAISD